MIRDVNESGDVIESAKEKPLESTPITVPVQPEMMEKAIHQVLGIENDSDKGLYTDKIKTLLDFAKSQTKDHSPENLKWIIRSLELKLGTPPFGEKRVNYLARFAYLMTEKSKIEKEVKQFEQL